MDEIKHLTGAALVGDETFAFEVEEVSTYSLTARFKACPVQPLEFSETFLHVKGKQRAMGRSRLLLDERSDHGRLLFLDHVYDFGRLLRSDTIRSADQDFKQLQLLFNYKRGVRAEFREYISDLVYQLQVYRKVFDDIDTALAREPQEVAHTVRARLIEAHAPEFNAFFDRQLEQLEAVTAGFTRSEHERHGFYFRRQVWDLILRSPFLTRTNVRPRGYSGDSVMMRWAYDPAYVGDSTFGQLMHRHPLECTAAQAVRNRREYVVRVLAEVRARLHDAGHEGPVRFMSLACGPAWELRDVFTTHEDIDAYQAMLLDQDDEALADATAAIADIGHELGRELPVRFTQDSVRTMLRTRDLSEQWGHFHFVYSMGLFDYLNRPVAEAVLMKIYALLEPGGELLIGNFHVGSSSRIYMDYWMDWTLLYRTEAELLEMAAKLPGANVEVTFDDTRCQMFLRVRRETKD